MIETQQIVRSRMKITHLGAILFRSKTFLMFFTLLLFNWTFVQFYCLDVFNKHKILIFIQKSNRFTNSFYLINTLPNNFSARNCISKGCVFLKGLFKLSTIYSIHLKKNPLFHLPFIEVITVLKMILKYSFIFLFVIKVAFNSIFRGIISCMYKYSGSAAPANSSFSFL